MLIVHSGMNPFHLTPRLLFDVPATFVIFLPCKVAPAASRQEEKAIYCLILQMLLEITFNNTNSTRTVFGCQGELNPEPDHILYPLQNSTLMILHTFPGLIGWGQKRSLFLTITPFVDTSTEISLSRLVTGAHSLENRNIFVTGNKLKCLPLQYAFPTKRN